MLKELLAMIARDDDHGTVEKPLAGKLVEKNTQVMVSESDLTIVPDCIGNRGFCHDGINCLRPDYTTDALLEACQRAMQMTATAEHPGLNDMRAAARATAEEHTLDSERAAFYAILDNMDQLWEDSFDSQV